MNLMAISSSLKTEMQYHAKLNTRKLLLFSVYNWKHNKTDL